MKDTIMALYNAIVAGEKQDIIDAFADILNAIFEIVKVNM